LDRIDDDDELINPISGQNQPRGRTFQGGSFAEPKEKLKASCVETEMNSMVSAKTCEIADLMGKAEHTRREEQSHLYSEALRLVSSL